MEPTVNHYRIIFEIESKTEIARQELIDIASIMGSATDGVLPEEATIIKVAAGEVLSK